MWVRRVCCSDVGMEGVAVVVDGEGFVGCVRGLRDALAGLPVVVGLLPSSRAAHGVVARGYDVFGQGAFGDMVALSCTVSPGAGAARAEAMRFLDGVISVVGKSGMVGWLFRVLWRADGSLLDAYGRVAEGRMPLPGEESAGELEGYVDAVCRMGAWVLLRWSLDDDVTRVWADLLLQGRYLEVLDGMMPYVSVSFDSRGVERMKEVLAFRESGAGLGSSSGSSVSVADAVGVSTDSVDADVADAAWDAALSDAAIGLDAGVVRASRQYVFDSEHVEAACGVLAGVESGDACSNVVAGPWLDRNFVDSKARGLVGARLVSLLMRAVDERDGEALHEVLGVLSDCRDCVRGYGVPALPIMLAGMGQDMTARRGGRRDDGSSPEALDMSAAAAVVALTWIADVKAARNMGLALLSGDMPGYVRLADQFLNGSAEMGVRSMEG